MTEPAAAPTPHLAALGPFCAFETHPEGSELTPPWRTLSELTEEGNGALRERVASVRASLAANYGSPPEAVESRVAASVAHLGLMARVISPALGLATLHGLPSRPLTLGDLRWRSSLSGAFPLSLPREAVTPAAAEDVQHGYDPGSDTRPVSALADDLLTGPVHDLVATFAPFSVSQHILWGNVASAVNGAATGITAAAPSLAHPAHATALTFLQHPRLRNTHTLNPHNARFTRRSCCLIYRAAPGGTGAVCGDCVLLRGSGGGGRVGDGRGRRGRGGR
ncbi:(2Fe-2S)-binding protein [Streptomyces sp. P9-2B-2]|uniref:(2Fe-2S)-binding protein n=1 Tax=Streptomyces sp. P9-2B-2 TaxID=3057114 RepID=UPI0025B354B4|nr:(2Fe-2S)-binding protein [Streptomyces sp. P9-2B-2]WJY36444.1 (2Fe-2S)-binding protein [Streptomyces sp. P9-2B-2]